MQQRDLVLKLSKISRVVFKLSEAVIAAAGLVLKLLPATRAKPRLGFQ